MENSEIDLNKNHKRFSFRVLIFLFFCALLLLERLFYQIVVKNQISILSTLQLNLGLTKMVNNVIQPTWIKSQFQQFFGSFSSSKIQFLLLTHIFVSSYVTLKTQMVAKFMYTTFAIIYAVSLIQIIYAGARPYWVSDSIFASVCSNNFSHPSLGLIIMAFILFYLKYCLQQSYVDDHITTNNKNDIIYIFGVFIITFVIQFINYVSGIIFIINIALSTVFLLVFILMCVSFDQILNKNIKKLLFAKSQNFEYNCIFWILFLQAFLLIMHSDSATFDINWIKNYSDCTKYLNYQKQTIYYNQALGSRFTILQTTYAFAWISSIFAIKYCYSSIAAKQWYQGSTGQKISKVLISNLFMTPSWIFVTLIESGEWIRELGLTQYIVDSFHFSVLYFWLFGLMPVLILQKLLNLTPRKQDGEYIMLLEKQ